MSILTKGRKSLARGLRRSLQEVHSIEAGKLKGKPIEELLNSLSDGSKKILTGKSRHANRSLVNRHRGHFLLQIMEDTGILNKQKPILCQEIYHKFLNRLRRH